MSMRISRRRSMRQIARAVATIAVVVIVLPLLASCGVNSIPTYQQQAKAAWAEVLNQYQRRTDLIPNLVSTVKGAADFESKTLQAVVAGRPQGGPKSLPAALPTHPPP